MTTVKTMNTHSFSKILLIGLLLVLGGCATQPVATPIAADPWESSNRAVFQFNDTVDKAIFKPISLLSPLMLLVWSYLHFLLI